MSDEDLVEEFAVNSIIININPVRDNLQVFPELSGDERIKIAACLQHFIVPFTLLSCKLLASNMALKVGLADGSDILSSCEFTCIIYHKLANKLHPSSIRKCNTWRGGILAGTLGVYGKRIQAS